MNLFICDENYSQTPYLDFKNPLTSKQCDSQLARYKKTSFNYSLVFIGILQVLFFIRGSISIHPLLISCVVLCLIYRFQHYQQSLLLFSSILTLTLASSSTASFDAAFLINLPSFLIRNLQLDLFKLNSWKLYLTTKLIEGFLILFSHDSLVEFGLSAGIFGFVICLLEKDFKDMWILLDSNKRTLLQYLALIDNLNLAFFLLDSHGKLLTSNKEAKEVCKAYFPDSDRGVLLQELIPDHSEHIESCINNLSMGQSSVFDINLHNREHHGLYKVIIKRISFVGDHVFSVIFLDITDNYQLQQSFFDVWFRNSEQTLAQLKEMDISSEYDCLKVEDFNNLEYALLDNFYVIIAFGDKLGKISCKKNLFCAQAELEEIINCVWKKAEKKELNVNLVLDEDLPKGIEGDRLMIKLLYRSLMDYMIKYSCAKGYITIAVKVEMRRLSEDGPMERFLNLKLLFLGSELSLYDLEYYFKKRVNMMINYREMMEVSDKNGISIGVMHIIMRYLQVTVDEILIEPGLDNRISVNLLIPINSVPDSRNTRGRIGVIYGNRNLNDIRTRWVPQPIKDLHNSRIRTYLSFSQVRRNKRKGTGHEADIKSCTFGSRVTDASMEITTKPIHVISPPVNPDELSGMDYDSDEEFHNIEEGVAVDSRNKLIREVVRNTFDMTQNPYRIREEASTVEKTQSNLQAELVLERDANKVLLVMSSKIMARSISRTLSRVIKSEPETASSKEEAISLYKSYAESGFRYLVVFIDSKLNNEPGLVLAKSIREIEYSRHYVRTPIFMFYQESEESTAQELLTPEIDRLVPRSANVEAFTKIFSHLQ